MQVPLIVKAEVVVVVPVPKKLKVVFELTSIFLKQGRNGYLESTLQSGEAGINMCCPVFDPHIKGGAKIKIQSVIIFKPRLVSLSVMKPFMAL